MITLFSHILHTTCNNRALFEVISTHLKAKLEI